MMIFGNTTNTTCRFSFKRCNLFYTVQKHDICLFMETVTYDKNWLMGNTKIQFHCAKHGIQLVCNIVKKCSRIWLVVFAQRKSKLSIS